MIFWPRGRKIGCSWITKSYQMTFSLPIWLLVAAKRYQNENAELVQDSKRIGICNHPPPLKVNHDELRTGAKHTRDDSVDTISSMTGRSSESDTSLLFRKFQKRCKTSVWVDLSVSFNWERKSGIDWRELVDGTLDDTDDGTEDRADEDENNCSRDDDAWSEDGNEDTDETCDTGSDRKSADICVGQTKKEVQKEKLRPIHSHFDHTAVQRVTADHEPMCQSLTGDNSQLSFVFPCGECLPSLQMYLHRFGVGSVICESHLVF